MNAAVYTDEGSCTRRWKKTIEEVTMNYTDVRDALTGPIPSVHTPYTREGEIDYRSLARLLDAMLEAGARAVVLTAGDSHYEAMSDREVGDVTRFTAQHVNHRAFMVAADFCYDTKHAVAFARECAGMDVDMLMVKPPNWQQSPTPETLAEHYAAVSREIPVMMVTNIFIPRGPAFGLATVKATMRATDRVLAVKDDMGEAFARRLTTLVHDRWAVWAGGRKENHLNIAPYGAHGYLSTFLPLMPQVAWDYWNAWQDGRMADAIRIIKTIDIPFFDFVCKSFSSPNLAFHAIGEICGRTQRWRPKPYSSATDAEVELIREWLKERKLI